LKGECSSFEAILLIEAQQDVVEVVLGEEVTVIATLLEDVGNYLLILALLQSCLLPRAEVVPGELQRPFLLLPIIMQILDVVAGGLGTFNNGL
jgi:hypothetical protein